MSVTLYRVRRPDGTLIDKPPHSEKAIAAASAWDELPKGKRALALMAKDHGLRLLWLLADEGYTIEPVEYVPAENAGRP